MSVSAELLRVLQQAEVAPIGDIQPVNVAVPLIAAISVGFLPLAPACRLVHYDLIMRLPFHRSIKILREVRINLLRQSEDYRRQAISAISAAESLCWSDVAWNTSYASAVGS